MLNPSAQINTHVRADRQVDSFKKKNVNRVKRG